MRITKKDLQRIIDDEIESRLAEANQFVLKESLTDVRDADLTSLVRFAKAYGGMSVTARERLDQLLANANLPYDRAAAMEMMGTLSGLNDELDSMLDEWRASVRRSR